MRWMSPRRGSGLLLAALLLATGLAGCLGAAPPPNEPAAPAPVADPPPPLPTVALRAETAATRATIFITLTGPTAGIASFRFDPGDGTGGTGGEGVPPDTLVHDYPPMSYGAPPRLYEAHFTLLDRAAKSATTKLHITVEPAVPPAPVPVLSASDATSGGTPLLVTFHLGLTDEARTLRSWTFDPGDGTAPRQGTGTPPALIRHEYQTIGAHSARLELTATTGATTIAALPILVHPPHDTSIWNLDRQAERLEGVRPDGTTIVARNVTHPSCATSANCPRPIDIAARGNRIVILYSAPQTGGTALLVDATTGNDIKTVPLSLRPDALHKDPLGRIWATHTGQPHITRIDTERQSVHPYALALTNGATLHPVWDKSASKAWILIADTPSRIVRLDTLTGETVTTVLPHAEPATLIRRSDTHGTIHVASTDGTVHSYITSGDHLVPVRRILPETDGTPRSPTALTCPAANDHCWLAYAPNGPRPGLLLGIPARSPTTDLTLLAGTALRIALPIGLTATHVHGAGDRFALAYHDNTGTTGILLLDPTGNETSTHAAEDRDAPTAARPQLHLEPHPRQGRLLYHADSATAQWRVFDLHAERFVHTAPLGSTADRVALAAAPGPR